MNWNEVELSSCVKVEVAVLDFPSLIVLIVSVDMVVHAALVGEVG